MESWIDEHDARLQPRGWMLRRHAHAMTPDEQFNYADRLADYADVPRLQPWRKEMFVSAGINKRRRPESYRDVWDCSDELTEKDAV